MKIMESAENYLETILMLKAKNGSVRSIDIAHELEFSKPSVSVAMKRLRENGHITVEEGGKLTIRDSAGTGTITGGFASQGGGIFNDEYDGSEGDVYVEISGGSKWVLTGDAYVKSLTCDADSIDLNGHTLYVDGQAYEAGTASTGSAIAVVVSESSHGGPGGDAPSGGAPSGGSSTGRLASKSVLARRPARMAPAT